MRQSAIDTLHRSVPEARTQHSPCNGFYRGLSHGSSLPGYFKVPTLQMQVVI